MNFYWRQTIVGLLRYAAGEIPEVAERSLAAAKELDRALTSPWLEEAFEVFQGAALLSRNPVYVTGAYYCMRALDEVGRWERQAGGPIRTIVTEAGDVRVLPGGPDILPQGRADSAREQGPVHSEPGIERDQADRDIIEESQGGILELFERIRRGATLEEALALFPHLGDESSPD